MRPVLVLLEKKKSSKYSPLQGVIAQAIQGEGWKNYRIRADVGYFASQIGLELDRGLFTWDGHEYLRRVYEDQHSHIVGRKATQLGLTVCGIIRVIHHSIFLPNYAGAIYFFPTDKDVSEFSRARVSPILENKILKDYIKNTDSIGLKRIGNAHVYFRGMKSRVGLKATPADELVFDELDEVQDLEGFSAAGARKMALERLSHSPYKFVFEISNPTFPGYGVDVPFQSSDQCYWHMRCDGCKKTLSLDDLMPQILGQDVPFLKQIGKSSELSCHECGEIHQLVHRVCVYCGHVLNPSIGEWVPKYPERVATRGYQFSQFLSQYVSAGEILHEYRTTTQPEVFYNTKIGIPWVSAENRITVDQVLELCDSTRSQSTSDVGPCTMGVDVGKFLHVVISKWNTGTTKRLILHIAKYHDFSELDDLMTRFHVTMCVIDGQPEQKSAREFQKRHLGKVWLNYFNSKQKGNYVWDQKQCIVQENRTEAFDATRILLRGQLPFHEPLYVLPRQEPVVIELATHISNDAKKRFEDGETGAVWYEYVKLGVNHYDTALLYDTIAWSEDLKRRKVLASIAPKLENAQESEKEVEQNILERFASSDGLPEPLRSEWFAARNREWFRKQALNANMPVHTPSGTIIITPEFEASQKKKKSDSKIDREIGLVKL